MGRSVISVWGSLCNERMPLSDTGKGYFLKNIYNREQTHIVMTVLSLSILGWYEVFSETLQKFLIHVMAVVPSKPTWATVVPWVTTSWKVHIVMIIVRTQLSTFLYLFSYDLLPSRTPPKGMATTERSPCLTIQTLLCMFKLSFSTRQNYGLETPAQVVNQ